MSDTLYERYNTGDTGYNDADATAWNAQSFTVGNTGTNENHNITSVKLLLYRNGSPGTVTVSIRAVDGNGKPTEGDLTSGTTDGNTLTTNTAGEWREIALTSYGLSASTKYAIVVRALDATGVNKVVLRLDGESPTYSGGALIYSTDSGNAWDVYDSMDILFEEYGSAGAAEGQFMQPTRYW